jgi:DNA-binding FadR family transcriptional regulator
MKNSEPQKNLITFLLAEGGGRYVAKLSPAPVVPVLLALTSMTDDDRVVRCSQTSLSENLGIGRMTLHRAINALEKAGIIERVGRSCFKVLDVEAVRRMYHHDTNEARTYHHDTNNDQTYHHDTFEGVMYHHDTNEVQGDANHTSLNILPLRGSSSARMCARIATPPTDQEKIARLQKIITEKLGREVWERSTNWAELYDRANRDIELIEDAVIAYQEKVIEAGQNHSFTRLLNFVKRERASREKQAQAATTRRPYDRRVEVDAGARKATESELRRLEEILNGG